MFETIGIWALIGFLLATYSVVWNDAIQTLGTFIASNKKTKWYYLWIFASVILVITLAISFIQGSGDISSGRLEKIPYIEIEWYHALAPLVLVILTRFRIPLSTSLLVLSVFASTIVFEQILLKSLFGFGIAAVIGFVLWYIVTKWIHAEEELSGREEKYWRITQWGATGFLWYTWLSHDIANVAVFIPRILNVWEFIIVLIVFIAFLALIFYRRGGEIQKIVLEKKGTTYVRSATIIDICFAIILFVFKELSSIPMSTTWVFIGLLAGRELGIAKRLPNTSTRDVFPIVGRDILRLIFGLAISIAIAISIQNIDSVYSFFQNLI